MGVKFFGQFLVARGAVAPAELLKAVELQRSTNLKFGEMAQAMGLLSEADIQRVHNAQRGEDLPFGQMAVRLGLLTSAQMEQVLTRQENSYLFIGRALVEIGALDEGELESHLQAFQADQAPYLVEAVELPPEVPLPEVWEVFADLTYKMLTRVASLPHRKGGCQIVDRLPANHAIATMDLSGAVSARYLFSASPGVQAAIARTMLREDEVETGPQELLDDALMEFVNIICGNAVAKAAQLGYRIEIAPPQIQHPDADGLAVPAGDLGMLFPIHIVSDEQVAMAVFLQG
ncbi:chemotaxis protein CheX [Desulfuromonas versatilis]|uniref:Chemotaxis protein CheX n=1 Tax=Desulfuromonas versatilis TaxID=2802975 RepID=A0ABN6E2K6_9BACT|nr:chemotaxis protein CheX [Desulfuromonas versatilis]BCR06585.1 chemotaxis protein CheX [Desulfuromonas versatilis]